MVLNLVIMAQSSLDIRKSRCIITSSNVRSLTPRDSYRTDIGRAKLVGEKILNISILKVLREIL